MDWEIDSLIIRPHRLKLYREVEIVLNNTANEAMFISKMPEEKFLKALFGRRVWFRR
jgi:hypothetical protein